MCLFVCLFLQVKEVKELVVDPEATVVLWWTARAAWTTWLVRRRTARPLTALCSWLVPTATTRSSSKKCRSAAWTCFATLPSRRKACTVASHARRSTWRGLSRISTASRGTPISITRVTSARCSRVWCVVVNSPDPINWNTILKQFTITPCRGNIAMPIMLFPSIDERFHFFLAFLFLTLSSTRGLKSRVFSKQKKIPTSIPKCFLFIYNPNHSLPVPVETLLSSHSVSLSFSLSLFPLSLSVSVSLFNFQEVEAVFFSFLIWFDLNKEILNHFGCLKKRARIWNSALSGH